MLTKIFFTQHYWKKWIRQHDCKLAGGISSLNKNSTLIMENKTVLGHLTIRAPLLNIGANTYIRSGSKLDFVKSIGRFCSISSNVHIGQEKQTHPLTWVSSHPFQYTNNSPLNYPVTINMVSIGHDVWIGNNSVILEGVNIGTGAVIASHSVVTKDIPPYAIVAGNPAKIVRFRHPEEVCLKLLESQWWEYSIEDLKKLPLNSPEEFLNNFVQSALNKASYQKIKITRTGCEEII